MFSMCPKCKKWENQKYLGITCNYPKYLKIHKCENCNMYYMEEKKGGNKDIKTQTLVKREADSILKNRTACIKCQKFKKDKTIKRPPMDSKTDDYEYTGVVFKDFSIQKNGKIINRFYCNNHAKQTYKQRYKQRYQFSKKEKREKIVKLWELIEKSTSNYFYKNIRKIYKDTDTKHAHKHPKYNKDFKILYGIGLPQTALAKIFHTSQSSISRYIKEKKLNRENEFYIEEIRDSIFLTKARVNDEEIEAGKKFWKDMITSKDQQTINHK